MVSTPTLDQFRAYQVAYDYFNGELFDAQLKPCLLNFRGKHKRNMGLFWPRRWVRVGGGVTHEIALNPDVLDRPLADTFSTLVHEMVHQWQEDYATPPRGGYHDREWAAKMLAVGLVPSDTGKPGGKQTGQQMSHFIDPDGPFQRALDRMPADVRLPWLSGGLSAVPKPPSKNKLKVKYTCTCGQTVWGKAEMTVICGECGESFAACG